MASFRQLCSASHPLPTIEESSAPQIPAHQASTPPNLARTLRAHPPLAGSSPTIIHRHFFTELCDLWVDYGFKIRADQEADQAWGWVQEM